MSIYVLVLLTVVSVLAAVVTVLLSGMVVGKCSKTEGTTKDEYKAWATAAITTSLCVLTFEKVFEATLQEPKPFDTAAVAFIFVIIFIIGFILGKR